MCTHDLCFEQKIRKISTISNENFQFLQLRKNLLRVYITRAFFRNEKCKTKNPGLKNSTDTKRTFWQTNEQLYSERWPISYMNSINLVIVFVLPGLKQLIHCSRAMLAQGQSF